MPRWRHRTSLILASALLVAVPGVGYVNASAADPNDPRLVGRISNLFDEGFGKSPRCELEADGNVTCRPTALSTAVLPDSRVLYWNGIENTEQNVDTAVLLEAGRVLRDSQARLLDLSGASPQFTELARGTNGANPAGEYEVRLVENPGDTIGTGRPGDGLVGSTVGRVLPTGPVAPSADCAANDDDMFCSDLSQVPDGSILIAGGTDFYGTGATVPEDTVGVGGFGVGELEGIRTTRIFDPGTNTFRSVDPMKYGRWYPTLTTLADGDVLTASGVTRLVANTQLSQVRRTETFDVQTKTWEENYTGPASENSLPIYPRMHLAPSGKVFYAASRQLKGFGPTGYAADEALWGLYRLFDPKTHQWRVVGATQWSGLARGGVFSTPLTLTAPYDKMDVLVGGGTLGPTPGSGIATSLSEVITVGKDDSVTPRVTDPMKNPRWFSSGTLLPDGQVLASGGANRDHVIASGWRRRFARGNSSTRRPGSGRRSRACSGTEPPQHRDAAARRPRPDRRSLADHDRHRTLAPGRRRRDGEQREGPVLRDKQPPGDGRPPTSKAATPQARSLLSASGGPCSSLGARCQCCSSPSPLSA